MSQKKIATIFGGTGFVGRHIVQRLAKAGYTVKVATRAAESAYFLRPCGMPGQIVPFRCDYNDAQSVGETIRGSEVVINCIGILYEKDKKSTFRRAHVEIPRVIAQVCARENVARFVYISALGIDHATSRYAQSKREGERAVREIFPAAVILRPSVIFGPEDSFFNMFAELARYTPALPLIGGGKTKFQPVYVGDVADAVMASLWNGDASGKTYELGGPEVVTLREIYQRLFAVTGRRRCLISMPFGLAKIQASFMQMLPHPLLTRDQVESLKTDSVVSAGALTLDDLGIPPAALDAVLPDYLAYCRPGGVFADKKKIA